MNTMEKSLLKKYITDLAKESKKLQKKLEAISENPPMSYEIVPNLTIKKISADCTVIVDFNISASTLINVKNEKDSSKCTKKFWYDETAATPTCRVNHGVQPTGDVTSAQKALLISNLSTLNNWQVGAPTASCGNCPDGWIYNGKSKCFKVFGGLEY